MTHNGITEEVASENRNYLKGEDTKGTSQPWEQLYFNHISLKIQSRCKKKLKRKKGTTEGRREGGIQGGREERKERENMSIVSFVG